MPPEFPVWEGEVSFSTASPDIDYERLAADVAKAISPQVARATAGGGLGGVLPMSQITGGPGSQMGLMPMETPLPRAPGVFDSQFGPGFPYLPFPLDAVQPGQGDRVPPRRSAFEVAWNLQLLDREVPWTMLRDLSEKCDIIHRCIEISIDTICGYDFDFTVSNAAVRAMQANDPSLSYAQASHKVQQQYMGDLDKARSFWESPDRDMGQSFSDWLTAMLWDYFVYDAVAVYPRLNLDGSLRNLELIDGSTIKVYRDNRGRLPQFPNPAFGQVLWGFVRGEFQHNAGEAEDEYYAALTDLPPEFQRDQLAYYLRRPRNWSVYGYSPVEECIPAAITYLGRAEWMREEYQTGSTPNTFMKIGAAETDAWSPQQIAGYEAFLNSSLSGLTGNRHRIKVIRNTFEPVQMQTVDEKYKQDYDTHLITQIGAKFGVAASQLGIQAKAGLSGGKQMAGEMQQAETVSQKPLLQWLIDKINDLNRRFLDIPSVITATFDGGDNDEDALRDAQRDQILLNTGQKTLNDIRGEAGDPLYEFPEADQPFIATATGPTFLSGEFQNARAGEAIAANAETMAQVGGAEDAAGGANGSEDDTNEPTTTAKPTATTDTSKPGSSEKPGSGTIPKSKTGDPGQEDEPDKSGSDTNTKMVQAEIAKFVKYATNSVDQGRNWRDFKFEHASARVGRLLNHLGEHQSLDEIKMVVADVAKVLPAPI